MMLHGMTLHNDGGRLTTKGPAKCAIAQNVGNEKLHHMVIITQIVKKS
jgi:hypothetical protein